MIRLNTILRENMRRFGTKNLLTESSIGSQFVNKLKTWENSIKDGWDASKQKWFPHKSYEGGSDTIAYGHKIQTPEEEARFSKGITEDEATELFNKDIGKTISRAQRMGIPVNSVPDYVKAAIVNAIFRGELKSTHKTVKYMAAGNWSLVPKEYLNNAEYKREKARKASSIAQRMDWNAAQFRKYASEVGPK